MSDPLDAVFVTDKDEVQRLKRSRQLVALAKYIDNMPMELKPLFKERFSLIDNADLAQLRATITEQARQLEEARNVMMAFFAGAGARQMRAWLAANPAPEAEQQP